MTTPLAIGFAALLGAFSGYILGGAREYVPPSVGVPHTSMPGQSAPRFESNGIEEEASLSQAR